MNATKVIGALGLAVLTSSLCGQVVDKYGISVGASYANQDWRYQGPFAPRVNNDFKVGMAASLFAEKHILKPLHLRLAIGYVQKGFKSNLRFTDINGVTMGPADNNVTLHNLCADVVLKFKPFTSTVEPYLLAGVRGNYRIAYTDAKYVESGSGLSFGIYGHAFDQFNKTYLEGLFGIGAEFKNLFFLEGAYNPSFTKSFDTSGLEVTDKSWELRLGLNLNKLWAGSAKAEL